MSIVLVADRFETIRPVIACLRKQTIRDRLELVLAGPSREALTAREGELYGFAAVRTVVVPSVTPLSASRAAAVRAASAPLVFIGETHSYPEPDFAEVMLRTHEEGWPVVVPGFSNANPEGACSWGSFVLDYGAWWDGLPPGEIRHAPVYNTVCKREVLAAFGERLHEAFEHGDVFLTGVRERGQRVYFQPAARISHTNASLLSVMAERYAIGRLRGGDRAVAWPAHRRLAYVAGAPLIPFVLLWRLRGPLRAFRRHGMLAPGTAAFIGVSLLLSAFGEALGYARGRSVRARDRVDEFEVHKLRFIRADSRARLEGLARTSRESAS